MSKKKNIIQSAIDSLREALQILPVKKAIERKDKRSIKRGKAIIKDLEKKFKPSEIAAGLELPNVQKYVALRKNIESGKIASSTLNDLLSQTEEKIVSSLADFGNPQDLRGDYIADKPIRGKRKFEIDYVEMGEDYINKKMPWVTDIKPGGFASKQSALNWYGGVTGGKGYFAIVRKKFGNKTRWHIYDTRTESEKSRKGSVSGSTRADRLYKEDKIN